MRLTIRRRLLLVPLAAALAVGTWAGIAPAGASPTALNQLCKDPAFQEAVAAASGVAANHGQCQKAVLETSNIPVVCRDPAVQESVAAFTGTKPNYGQCRKALANLLFGG